MSSDVVLTTAQQTRLDELEQVIETGIAQGNDANYKIGVALIEIKSDKLYTHKTFESYVTETWGFVRQRAYQLMDGAAFIETLGLSTAVDKPDERVLRELAPLRHRPEEMRSVYKLAETEANGVPASPRVQAIVKQAVSKETSPAERVPTRSTSTLASVTRAFNAALDDGWSLEEIAETIETAHRKRLA